jgi:phospholipase/carboxylesterase
MENKTHLIHVDEWVIRLRVPNGSGPHPVLYLLHGLTGDENVMWVFANRIPDRYLVIAPRGLYPEPIGGYSWYKNHRTGWPAMKDMLPAIQALQRLPEQLQRFSNQKSVEGLTDTRHVLQSADFRQLSLVGFSQGAAFAYIYAMLHPEQTGLVAGLAGFVPEGVGEVVEMRPLEGIPVFVTHGTQDDIVPIERARKSVGQLEQAGAEVTYCEENVGHKLSASCFRAMGTFFSSYAYDNGRFVRRD